MKAALLYGKQDLRIEDVDEPVPGQHEVKLRNAYSGICGSDLDVYEDPASLSHDLSAPHPVTGACLPQVMGHEFSGTIVELGSQVDTFQLGEQVAVWPTYYCRSCPACIQGLYNACAVRGLHGMHSYGGGIAEYTTVPAYMLHRLPKKVDLRMGALVQPLAVSWHGVQLARPHAGETALIVGGGPVGLGVWLALQAIGVERILVSEPHAARRARLASLGAEVIDPISQDLHHAIHMMTHGQGVSVAYEAAGVGAALHTALQAVGPRGQVVVLGLHTMPVEVFPMALVERETSVLGSSGYLPEDFDEVIDAMSQGAFNLTEWVEEVEIEDTVKAIHRLGAGADMKILIRVASAA